MKAIPFTQIVESRFQLPFSKDKFVDAYNAVKKPKRRIVSDLYGDELLMVGLLAVVGLIILSTVSLVLSGGWFIGLFIFCGIGLPAIIGFLWVNFHFDYGDVENYDYTRETIKTNATDVLVKWLQQKYNIKIQDWDKWENSESKALFQHFMVLETNATPLEDREGNLYTLLTQEDKAWVIDATTQKPLLPAEFLNKPVPKKSVLAGYIKTFAKDDFELWDKITENVYYLRALNLSVEQSHRNDRVMNALIELKQTVTELQITGQLKKYSTRVQNVLETLFNETVALKEEYNDSLETRISVQENWIKEALGKNGLKLGKNK